MLDKLVLDDVLGATFIRQRRICVDESLLEHNSGGRLCFTFAHEIGHWTLHRKLIHHACRATSKESGGFTNVSKQAMIIRLQELGLVKNETRTRLSWKESFAMT